MVPFILRSDSISLFPANAAPIIIDSSHMNFMPVAEAIKEGRFDDAVELASVESFLNKISSGNVTVTDDEVLYKGQPLNGYLASKLVQFFREGLPVEHYCAFLSNLMDNPSMVSRKELYLFLESANLPVTEDGCFLAYKAVRHDFKDKHSGRFDNSPGVTHEMERHEVDDDRNQTCSYGFHAAAYQYARDFLGGGGDKMVAVKINPKDVVSVPSDYNNQKLRCCKYTVMFEIPGAIDVFKDRAYYDEASMPQPKHDDKTNTYFWGAIWNDDGEDDVAYDDRINDDDY